MRTNLRVIRLSLLAATLTACGAEVPPLEEPATTEAAALDDDDAKADGAAASCGVPAAVDCSVPTWAQQVSPSLIHYANRKFKPACVIHDYCYRFGATTYGKSREACDDEFHSRMRRICDRWGVEDFLTLGGTKLDCYARAGLFYAAVRSLGGPSHAGAAEGSCCEYQGPSTRTRCGCEPRCDGRTCGTDGCGGVCGQCGADETCRSGHCVEVDPCHGYPICP